MSVKVPRNRPLLAVTLFEALAADSRRAILGQLLSERDGLMASELSRRLGLTLPTILSHLDKLVAAGLVKAVPVRRGGKVYKRYKAVGTYVRIEADLSLVASVPPREELERMLATLLEKLRERGVLPERLDPRVAAEVLGLDASRAVIAADYYNMSREKILEMLVEEAEEAFKGRDSVDLAEIEERLRLPTYWAVKVANRLEELGALTVSY